MTSVPAWIDGALRPVEKLHVHREGLRHKAVSVFVLNRGRVLLQQRALGKYHTPGLWANSCCTHPEWGEAASDCARRRLREELGIDGLAPVLRERVEYRAEVGGGMVEHEVVDIFAAAAPDDLPVRPDRAEVMATEWVTLADLSARIARRPADYTPWLRIYLAEHGEAIFGRALRD